tara:strand:- start:204 stop:467 length:264 start_codon:yes stop_codon:yes gene_type:complete
LYIKRAKINTLKKLVTLIAVLFITAPAYAQEINVEVGAGSNTEIIVEDKSVEAVKEMYRQESLLARDKRIRKASNAKLSNWINNKYK